VPSPESFCARAAFDKELDYKIPDKTVQDKIEDALINLVFVSGGNKALQRLFSVYILLLCFACICVCVFSSSACYYVTVPLLTFFSAVNFFSMFLCMSFVFSVIDTSTAVKSALAKRQWTIYLLFLLIS